MPAPHVLTVSPDHPGAAALRKAAAVLRAGGLVAFPTETVYGLGANALDGRAVARIFSAKGRPAYNPVIVHVASAGEAQALVTRWPPAADALAGAFWPGPLTLVLPRSQVVPDIVTAGAETVAVRVPAHPVALALIKAAGVPLAAPSANRSSAVSPTTAEHVVKSLGDRVDLVLDGGPTQVGIESTVLDLTGPRPIILRPGPLSAGAIEAVAGPLGHPGAPGDGEAPRRSPGMLDRHYAPHANLRLFLPEEREAVAAELAEAVARGRLAGGLILSGELPGDHILRMPDDPAGYARALYAALHQLDDLGCSLVAIEMVPDTLLWGGVRDRLLRAATSHD
jgi:L-threonylcarbamoyladenylate synthase